MNFLRVQNVIVLHFLQDHFIHHQWTKNTLPKHNLVSIDTSCFIIFTDFTQYWSKCFNFRSVFAFAGTFNYIFLYFVLELQYCKSSTASDWKVFSLTIICTEFQKLFTTIHTMIFLTHMTKVLTSSVFPCCYCLSCIFIPSSACVFWPSCFLLEIFLENKGPIAIIVSSTKKFTRSTRSPSFSWCLARSILSVDQSIPSALCIPSDCG